MGCHNCGNSNCSGCSRTDELMVCLGVQIEQIKNRTDQLKRQVEELNTGEPFDPLCPVQECNLPACSNTGTVCAGGSPTGRVVGQTESCCSANPPNLGDYCDGLAKKIRTDSLRITKLEVQVCEIRQRALKTILLDNNGDVRGGITISGKIVNFSAGSWETAITG